VVAGATWTRVIASAPWAARYGHTSVIDAAGAIYVIGGYGTDYLNDVWVSTVGGAGGRRMGYSRGTSGYLGVLERYSRGYSMVLC
jgi:hypothetical protein